MLPVRPPLAAAAATAASEPRPLLPPARDIPLTSATSATPARDVHCSRSPAPSTLAAKKKAVCCSRSPTPSAPAAKKKAAVDTGTGRPALSATLLPHPPNLQQPGEEQTRLKRSRTEAGQERCPTSRGETLPPEIVKKTLVELFKDYSGGQEIAQDPYVSVQTNASGRYADWDNHVNLNSQPTNEVPTELEVYLSKQSHTSKKARLSSSSRQQLERACGTGPVTVTSSCKKRSSARTASPRSSSPTPTLDPPVSSSKVPGFYCRGSGKGSRRCRK